MRSDQRGYTMVDQLLDLFHDSELGRTAAASLSVIAEDKDRVLSKENFAVIRVSSLVAHRSGLAADHDRPTTASVQAALLHLSPAEARHVVQGGVKRGPGHLPHCAVVGPAAHPEAAHFVRVAKGAFDCLLGSAQTSSQYLAAQLLPLLITALDLPDPLLRANVIDALAVLVKEVPAEMENSISGIAGKVLKGLTGGAGAGQTPAQARSAAVSRASLFEVAIAG